MVRATLTAVRSRRAAWAAKFLVVGAWVLVVALLTTLVSLLAGWLWLRGDGLDPVYGATWASGRPHARLHAAVHLAGRRVHRAGAQPDGGAGAAVPVAAGGRERRLGGVLAGARAAPHAEVTRFLPFNAGARIISQVPEAGSAFGSPLAVSAPSSSSAG